MFNLDNVTEKNDYKDWPYRKLIIRPSGSDKTKYLLNSIQKDNNIIDKIYLIMILLLLLSILILWMIFSHKLKINTEKEKGKYL